MSQNAMQFLDMRRAAQEYPLCRRKLYQDVKEGKIKAYKVGGKIIVRRADIEQYLTANPVGADLDRMVSAVAQEVLGK